VLQDLPCGVDDGAATVGRLRCEQLDGILGAMPNCATKIPVAWATTSRFSSSSVASGAWSPGSRLFHFLGHDPARFASKPLVKLEQLTPSRTIAHVRALR